MPERYQPAMFRTDAAVDALLACMARGWTLPQLSIECTPADMGAGAGVIIARLRDATKKRPPVDADYHGPFTQPLPWCGECDSPRTRWFELATGGVVRCPVCWVDPPHLSRWAPRCIGCGVPTRIRDLAGRPMCGRCLT
jgi:hypothetical protein